MSKILIKFLFSFSIIFFTFFSAFYCNAELKKEEIRFAPQITVGTFIKGSSSTVPEGTAMIGEYIKQIYKYLIGIVGILAVVVMMYGGVIWMMSFGNSSRAGEAKSWIAASLTGLLLVMFSYVILKTINPALVDFRIHKIQQQTTKTIEQDMCMSLGGTIFRRVTSEEDAKNECQRTKCTISTVMSNASAMMELYDGTTGFCCICEDTYGIKAGCTDLTVKKCTPEGGQKDGGFCSQHYCLPCIENGHERSGDNDLTCCSGRSQRGTGTMILKMVCY